MNVAKDIGNSVTFDPKSHDSIKAIKENKPDIASFEFRETDEETIGKIIKSLDIKKATGEDNISAKLLKASVPIINEPICNIVNESIRTSSFPNKLKMAQVTPLFKKNDPLDVRNYRPVSILPQISKIFEKVLEMQLSDYFENLFHECLCAFRNYEKVTFEVNLGANYVI